MAAATAAVLAIAPKPSEVTEAEQGVAPHVRVLMPSEREEKRRRPAKIVVRESDGDRDPAERVHVTAAGDRVGLLVGNDARRIHGLLEWPGERFTRGAASLQIGDV